MKSAIVSMGLFNTGYPISREDLESKPKSETQLGGYINRPSSPPQKGILSSRESVSQNKSSPKSVKFDIAEPNDMETLNIGKPILVKSYMIRINLTLNRRITILKINL